MGQLILVLSVIKVFLLMLKTRNGVIYYRQIEGNLTSYWRIELCMLQDTKMIVSRGERLIKLRDSSFLRKLFR